MEYDAAVLEAYSAGLAKGEWDGADLDVVVLTSFGHDHLDVHRTPEAYAASKLRLLRSGLGPEGRVIVSRKCELRPAAARIARQRGRPPLTYGAAGEVRARSVRVCGDGLAATIEAFGVEREVRMPLSADFLLENALAAFCLAVMAGVPPTEALDALVELVPPPGRMERAATIRGAEVFVDFAHNPEALEAALLWARRRAEGRVVVVLGCGGDRDTWKRPLMGEVAARYASRVLVTDDNPRSEDPATIREAVLEGCPGGEEVPDRIAAIEQALAIAGSGDVVLVCGRGAEEVQDLGDIRRDLSDVEVVRAAAAAHSRKGGG